MKQVISCVLLLLLSFYCYGKKRKSGGCVVISEKSLRIFEFYGLAGSNKTWPADSVFIYDYRLKRNGKIRDSILIAASSIGPMLYPDNYFFTYDTLGRKFQKFERRDGNVLLNAEYVYGKNGKIAQWIWFTREGKVHSRTFYDYDPHSLLRSENHYTGYWYRDTPHFESRITYRYADNRLVEENKYRDFQSDSSWSEHWTTRYDSAGRIVFYKDDGGAYYWQTTSTYNNQGLLSSELIEGNARETSIKSFMYSDPGIPTQLLWTNPNSKRKNVIRLTRYFYR
jgi:hypothetical protein